MEVAQKTYICCYWKTYNMKDVAIRFLSGVLFVSLIFTSIFLSREWFIGLIFVLAIITLNEFLRLLSLKGIIAYLLLAIAFYFFSFEIKSSKAKSAFSFLHQDFMFSRFIGWAFATRRA